MKTALRLMVFAAALLVGTGVSSLSGPGPLPPNPFPSNPGFTA
ncbi:MAG TPA: hypothetical protein VJN64_13305 [Terriglobales bacterium]|nr:hypothetical protein [Terriglobales bacterium]